MLILFFTFLMLLQATSSCYDLSQDAILNQHRRGIISIEDESFNAISTKKLTVCWLLQNKGFIASYACSFPVLNFFILWNSTNVWRFFTHQNCATEVGDFNDTSRLMIDDKNTALCKWDVKTQQRQSVFKVLVYALKKFTRNSFAIKKNLKQEWKSGEMCSYV